MNISDLSLLRCPYCEGSLTLKRVIKKQGDHIIYGIVSCACDEYPIIKSILILKKPINRTVLHSLSQGRFGHAFNQLIDLHRGYDRLIKFVGPFSTISRLYQKINFKSILQTLGYQRTLFPLSLFPDAQEWGEYLLRLPQAPESTVVDLLCSWFTKKTKIIIDVGCGITPYAPRITNKLHTCVGIDKSFTLLYFSSIFFPSNKQVSVCADINQGFPVRPGVGDIVLSLNCLTYVHNQQRTLRAMLQTAKPNGIVFVGDMPVTTPKHWHYWYPQKPSFYTTVTHKPFYVFDYDDLLRRLTDKKQIAPTSLRAFDKNGKRYGIIFTSQNP